MNLVSEIARETDGIAPALTHLRYAEHGLIWVRRTSLVGWGIMLLWLGYPIGFNIVWVTYALGIAYMCVLHWVVLKRRAIRATVWAATIGDSLLTFFICLVTDGASSVFIPFFYFTILADAFRFGFTETLWLVAFKALLLITLAVLHDGAGSNVFTVTITLLYMAIAAALATLLAGWARMNLGIAHKRFEALQKERDRSNALLQRLINTQEEERKRFAEDLHDRMSGRLFYLQHSLDRCAPSDSSVNGQNDAFATMRRELAACNADIRSLMNELRPVVLDEFGLYEAVTEYVAGMADLVPFRISMRLDPKLKNWRTGQDLMLFRLTQEALLNVRKHAGARHVAITLQRDGAHVVFAIEDDGVGFDPAHVPLGHFGLMTMRERAMAAGGELVIDSAPGRGTRIAVRFGDRS